MEQSSKLFQEEADIGGFSAFFCRGKTFHNIEVIPEWHFFTLTGILSPAESFLT